MHSALPCPRARTRGPSSAREQQRVQNVWGARSPGLERVGARWSEPEASPSGEIRTSDVATGNDVRTECTEASLIALGTTTQTQSPPLQCQQQTDWLSRADRPDPMSSMARQGKLMLVLGTWRMATSLRPPRPASARFCGPTFDDVCIAGGHASASVSASASSASPDKVSAAVIHVSFQSP